MKYKLNFINFNPFYWRYNVLADLGLELSLWTKSELNMLEKNFTKKKGSKATWVNILALGVHTQWVSICTFDIRCLDVQTFCNWIPGRLQSSLRTGKEGRIHPTPMYQRRDHNLFGCPLGPCGSVRKELHSSHSYTGQ